MLLLLPLLWLSGMPVALAHDTWLRNLAPVAGAPMLALGTLGLFVYAMIDPVHFAERMVGLNYVPEPLWWLLAAIVGFYFGAREAHYFRTRPVPAPPRQPGAAAPATDLNPALDELRSLTGD